MRELIVACALLAAVCTPAAAKPFATGDWSGTGQDNRGDRFAASLRLYADESASIAYEGSFQNGAYSCFGVLLPLARAVHGGRVFREKIVRGTCIDHGLVTLTPRKDGGLAFAWRGVEGGAPVAADLTLAPAIERDAATQ